MPERNLGKNRGVFDPGRASIRIAKDVGVDLGFGTDLLVEAQPWQNLEVAIRAELEPANDVLRSMCEVNPRLCGLKGRIGVPAPGAAADVVVTDVDPLENLAALAGADSTVQAVVAGGRIMLGRTER